MSTEIKETETLSEQEVINTYQMLRQEVSQLFTKLNDLENQKAEHKLVIDAIKDLDPKRKCFRLIGGVLVERTVQDTLPAVTEHMEKLANVMEKLTEQRDTKIEKVEELQKKYNIRVKGEEGPGDGGGGGGVRAAGLWRGCRGRGAVWRERVARGSRHGPGIVGHGCGARAEAGEGEEARVPGEGGSRRGHRGRRGCPGQAGR